MEIVRLRHETDVEGWRAAARRLRDRRIRPEDVVFEIENDEISRDFPAGCYASPHVVISSEHHDHGRGVAVVWIDRASPTPSPTSAESFTAPKAFLELAEQVVLHRAEDRFERLYRLLWRLRDAPALMRMGGDPEVAQARVMAREVVAAAQRMKAFLRFRPVQDHLGEAFAAWFEPAQRVTEAVSPFFARRFAGRRFSILTPDACAHWDGATLAFAPGADPPHGDSLEAVWRREHAWALDPDRPPTGPPLRAAIPGPGLSLPETGLMPELVARAEARGGESPDRAAKAAQRASRDAPYDGLPRTRGWR